jgi:hypothetical protein
MHCHYSHTQGTWELQKHEISWILRTPNAQWIFHKKFKFTGCFGTQCIPDKGSAKITGIEMIAGSHFARLRDWQIQN